MKRMMITMAMMMTIVASAAAMSFNDARREALFLTDKMAYELNLTDAQYDATYEINLDYFLSVATAADINGVWWTRRNADLFYVLDAIQYNRYLAMSYFYRPLAWHRNHFVFSIYDRYADAHRMFRARPTVFVSYRGGRNHFAKSHYADFKVATRNHSAPKVATRNARPTENRANHNGISNHNKQTNVNVTNVNVFNNNRSVNSNNRTFGSNNRSVSSNNRTFDNNNRSMSNNRSASTTRSFGASTSKMSAPMASVRTASSSRSNAGAYFGNRR